MSHLRFLITLAILAIIAGGIGDAAMAKPANAKKPASAGKAERICQPVQAIATGFGTENATRFVQGNLDLAIDKAKDQLTQKGARGFSIEKRAVTCGDYIDFGGGIGKEQKCRATANVCGKATG